MYIMCSKCGKKKRIDSFYVNKLNKSQNGRDFWCKESIKKYVKDKATMQEYCKENQRVFSETLWDDCITKAKNKYSGDPEFNSLDEEKRNEFALSKTINQYFSRQSQLQYYSHIYSEVDEIDNNGEEIIPEEYGEPTDPEKKRYSSKWGGDFKDEELIYLEDQYKKAQEQYTLKTGNDLEYAMNVAVAGLIVRKTRSAYLNNENGADKRWREAVNTYDSLCTSAKLNQKTRTENSNSGLGSFGEAHKRLEEMGFEPVEITFPRDSVDIILEEYAHSHIALRGALDDV